MHTEESACRALMNFASLGEHSPAEPGGACWHCCF